MPKLPQISRTVGKSDIPILKTACVNPAFIRDSGIKRIKQFNKAIFSSPASGRTAVLIPVAKRKAFRYNRHPEFIPNRFFSGFTQTIPVLSKAVDLNEVV